MIESSWNNKQIKNSNKIGQYPVHKYHLSDNIRKYKTKLQSNCKS